MTSMRDITTLRTDFLSALADIGFIPPFSTRSAHPSLNVNSENENLIKAVRPRTSEIFSSSDAAVEAEPFVFFLDRPRRPLPAHRPGLYAQGQVRAGPERQSPQGPRGQGDQALRPDGTCLPPPGTWPSSLLPPSNLILTISAQGSVLFGEAKLSSGFVAYFAKNMTTKVFLRDATEVSTGCLF